MMQSMRCPETGSVLFMPVRPDVTWLSAQGRVSHTAVSADGETAMGFMAQVTPEAMKKHREDDTPGCLVKLEETGKDVVPGLIGGAMSADGAYCLCHQPDPRGDPMEWTSSAESTGAIRKA